MGIEGHSADLHRLVASDASVRELASGFEIGGGASAGWGRGCDGPIWMAEDDCLSFTDTGNHRRLAWSPGSGLTVFPGDTNRAVGATRDALGRIVSCEWATGRVTRRELDGSMTVIASSFEGSRLNRPDDVVVGIDGSIIFSDIRDRYTDVREPFAVPQDECRPRSAVYRVVPDLDAIEMLSDELEVPGGLAFSPDYATLYVSDAGTREIIAFPAAPDGAIDASAASLISRIDGPGNGAPFGMTVDVAGNIYCGGPAGIWIVDPDGEHLGTIIHPASKTTNLAWGGSNWSTLFFTTPVGLGAIEMRISGVPLPAAARPVGAHQRSVLRVDSRIERHHPGLERIISSDAEVVRLAGGGVSDDLGGGLSHRFARTLEGAVWHETKGYLFFSDIGNDRQMKWKHGEGLSVLHQPTNHTNGAALDQQGRIVCCEHSARRVTRREPDGSVTVIADHFQGKRLSRPNDVVVRSDGSIYFTAPWWDFGSGEAREVHFNGVFRVPADLRTVTAAVTDFVLPNGLCFSPDERILYIDDTRRRHIRAFDVLDDGSLDLASDRVFAELHGDAPGSPDGMKVDVEGNVYCGGPGGIWILDPSGTHLGTIVHGAAQTNNLAFGGPDRRTLFFVSWVTLGCVQVRIPGVPLPPRAPAPPRAHEGATS